ncbi:hypothetical protein P175DRAFT_062663 [Aspergillus ochraceoroseus IBT 24754]|uniref:Myb-like domain-containing protein n=3 Tax=Aspergillus subgen. Nidulantes TaxID=2720870 RepID=A0A0F8WMU9_9EURO|nr:uncharacterized protein P175DRAFT_062663 [Aspergillus ochraceoroseus IBT 24754]KKK19030.1 hypothetical protein ARAM_004387 [Aspergillus rambellii]KKK24860.1 hypothetical protein AOCH_002363 [Aspergillus ochraceoroseus]PTU25098.1 hypothetical protein P175DRAFT_062663 [Aspergillus ochraceoroseus IBT 24754]
MSFSQSGSNPGEGLEEYFSHMPSQWMEAQSSPYGPVTHPYQTTPIYQAAAILTPSSLAENPYAHTRPSPVLSHHSQEYHYSIREPVPPHGLGISTPYPTYFSRNLDVGLESGPSGYGLREDTLSPPPSRKRQRRGSKQLVLRDPPVSILPHPDGLQRLEQERLQGHPDPHPHQRPRAPGRGRRDPQAEEEDAFVERLREQNLAWKVIREMFREKFNKDATEARLQMRQLRRRKERLARWDENDIRVLMRARHYWEQEKYSLIAQKMKEFGASGSYTPEQCEEQLRYIDSQRDRERSIKSRLIEPQPTQGRTLLKAPREKASTTT